MLRSFSALLLAAATTASFAQLAPLDPDWRETAAPPPPALKTEGLIALEMPGALLRYGIDPTSVTLGKDGVVRYVVVATSSSGAVNASYEGIRCAAGEFKVYARHTPGSGWTLTRDSPWMPLNAQGVSRHSLFVARSGGCMGHGTNVTAADIVRDLRAPPDERFRPERR
jgi:hypothetical protein